MTILRAWIAEGCISCNLCEDLAPQVFEVPPGETCRPRKGHERRLEVNAELQEKVQEAADSCPVEVIQLDKT